jgi:hypothetical protein
MVENRGCAFQNLVRVPKGKSPEVMETGLEK